MKNTISLFAVSILLCLFSLFGCKKESTSEKTGQVAFSGSNQQGIVTVTINGQTGTYSSYTSDAPACGVNNDRTVSFSFPVGTYPYTLSSTSFGERTGTVTITENGCVPIWFP